MSTPTALTVSSEVMNAINYVATGDLNRDICVILDPHTNTPANQDPTDALIVANAEGRIIGLLEQLFPRLSCLGLVGKLQNGLKMDKEWAAYAIPFIPRRQGAALLIAACLGYLEGCPEELSDLVVALACRSPRFHAWLGTIRFM